MCEFFSLLSDGKGKIYFFDSEMRKKIIDGETEYETTESHTSIAHYYRFVGEQEDKLNKWEYDVFTRKLTLDSKGTKLDKDEVLKQCRALDFKTIVPELIIKPIIHPFVDKKCTAIIPEDIELLTQWNSVRDSVEGSIWDSIGDFVGNPVREYVWGSVGSSVWDSDESSIWAIGDPVRGSIWSSIWAYVSSFFSIQYEHDFSSCIKLWEKGLIPSFDGSVWRLHGYPEGKIIWEGKLK